MEPPQLKRRRLLTLTGLGVASSVGGCTGSPLPADESRSETPTDTPSATPSADESGSTGDDSSTDSATLTDTATETGLSAPPGWPSQPYAEYETLWVHADTPDGQRLADVYTAVADTGDTRYTGLSDATSMPEAGGMLFVFGSVSELTFVMRDMDFGLDIVYADADGTITDIHHAPAPGPDEDGNNQRYPGTGKYVLEVNFEWTRRAGVSVGDVLEFER